MAIAFGLLVDDIGFDGAFDFEHSNALQAWSLALVSR